MTLQLESIELREVEMPLRWPFETSFGRTTRRRILIARVFDRSGAFGYGECTAPEGPFYNHETIDTAWLIITQFIAPMLADARISSAAMASGALSRIRGNRMAKGCVEAAIWDLEARLKGVPLWRHIGGTQTEIACGVSIGLQETTGALLEKVERELASGYRRIKIKIKPGNDIELIKAVRERHPAIMLSVDANAAYDLARDSELLKNLDDYGLLMIEQPLQPGDLVDHARLQRMLATAVCLDESIECVRHARQANELGACRIINIKLGRVGGFSEALAIHAFALATGIPVWCGGMLESGIGRAHNIALSTLPGFILPGDVSASDRYWEEDLIDPPVVVNRDGTIAVPPGAGIGFNVVESRIDAAAVKRHVLVLT